MRKYFKVLMATALVLAGTSMIAGAAEEKAAVILGVGGLGDQSYNDLVYAGMVRAEEELGVAFDYAEPKQVADYEVIMRDMCDSGEYEVIVCISFDQQDGLSRVAPDYPDQKFALIDGYVEGENIASYACRENEGAYLVGVLAALMKQDAETYGLENNHKYGFVGAMDIALMHRFAAGYQAGVQYIDPEAEVDMQYVGGDNPFADTTTAKEIANSQFSKGCDIIFHAAGGSGLGVFTAAAESDFIAIGCNSNQNVIDPEHIAASMLKKVDNLAFDIVKGAVEDTLALGQEVILGVAEDGIGYTVEETAVPLSEDIIKQVEEISVKIAEGEIEVPDAF